MRPRASILLSAIAIAAAVAACGGSSESKSNGVAAKSPQEALAAVRAAVAGAKSVHVAGSATKEGTPFSLDLTLVAGKGAQGQVSQGHLSFHMIEVGNVLYINGSPAFYSHFGGPAAAQLFKGKWLKAPANSPEFSSIGSLTDLSTLMTSLLDEVHGKLRSAGTSTVEGQKAAGLEDPTEHATLYVAATGKPYPLELSKTGKEAGRIVFNQWNQPATLKAPAGAIDITQLRGHS